LDETMRNNLIKGAVYFILKHQLIVDDNNGDNNKKINKIYTISIKDGDRGLADLSNGIFNYKCWEESKISDHETNMFYKDIKSAYDDPVNNNNNIIFVINIYKPNTDELLIGSWIQIDKSKIIKMGDSLFNKK